MNRLVLTAGSVVDDLGYAAQLGMTTLAARLQLPANVADERFTRIHALVDRVIGP